MPPKSVLPCAKYQYVLSSSGVPKILPVPDSDCKDEESPADYNLGGYLPVKVDDSFKNGRYRVLRKLGWGHFSTVWLVKDCERRCHSALKVVKSAGRYTETARDEIKLLNQVAAANKSHPGREFIVSFLDSFTHVGPDASHICIVFEPLGENLLALIERNRAEGVPSSIVKVIAKQILLGLMYLHDECDLVHTDIKPENIMISIPNVEEHITSELNASPLPTSKHISIPPNNRTSRAGLSIPSARQRGSRRSVQIFESQPLSSPGRRSGSNSVNNSYVAQMQMSKLSAQHGDVNSTNKISEMSSPSQFTKVSPPVAKHFATTLGAAGLASGTPSTSSSSSSISLTSKAAQSVGSTPPTSVSHSIGSAALGLLAMAQQQALDISDLSGPAGIAAKSSLPVSINKDKADSSQQHETAPTTGSWRSKLAIPASWKDKIALRSANSSSHSASSNADSAQAPGHSRKESKVWKDLGTSTLAPAVVVSASATAGGEADSDEFFPMPSASGDSTRSSSTQVPTPKPHSIGRQPGVLSRTQPNIAQPSLLTQTAPTHRLTSNNKRVHPHNSPAPRISHLSAHMQPHPSPSPSNETPLPVATGVPPLHTGADPPAANSPAASVTPTPTSFPESPPPAPPPTPSTQFPAPVNIPHSLRMSSSQEPPEVINQTPTMLPVSIKIADLGNATPSKRHFTEDIQTRQYRAPEAILGRRDWDARADIWSVACVLFELLAGEYLFDPRGQADLFTKDDDHMAQIIELMGDFCFEAKMGGRYSREIFDNNGQLRYIKTLKPWPLKRVMIEKYSLLEPDAESLCQFLEPMLQPDFRDRKHARDLVDHPWLEIPADELFLGEW